MISTKLLLLTPVYGAAATFATFIGISVLPDIEIKQWPVIDKQEIMDTWRTADMACFHWRYTKERAVTLVGQAFDIEREDGIRFPVQEIRPDLGIPSNDSTTAKMGIRRTIPECVNVPPVLKTTKRIVIQGHKLYRPFHGLYTVDQPMIQVLIDYLPDDSPPAPAFPK